MRFAGLRVQTMVQRRPAAEAIVEYAEQADIELIIMATHGHSGIKRWTHGSVADKVLRAGSTPILLVRAR